MASPPHSPPGRPSAEDSAICIIVTHHGQPHSFYFPSTATITDLTTQIETSLSIPAPSQKLLIPKFGLLKSPFPSTLLSAVPTGKKIQLLASTPAEIASVSASASPRTSRSSSPTVKAAAPAKTRDWRKAQDAATYTFHTLIPLPYLPQPERSLRYLEKLRDDAGIRAAMRAHRFSVGVLTEMNPAEHTTHESKTLGLNRNRGEVIELRLRTDAYDGYRDYKTIRKTLCHELAHNVFGEHDRDFWNLCGQIEKEVDKNDWRAGGRAVSDQEFYNPEDGGVEGAHVDGGGWSGGEFVLGGGGANGAVGMSRREVMAKAAEERARKQTGSGNRGD
ncbi:hypothetical protein MMC19_001915 [Ptychographa xylographoides]|nr:hypothetical protein [Ptychographa xylographoides]